MYGDKCIFACCWWKIIRSSNYSMLVSVPSILGADVDFVAGCIFTIGKHWVDNGPFMLNFFNTTNRVIVSISIISYNMHLAIIHINAYE
jgi:hypothetical protein